MNEKDKAKELVQKYIDMMPHLVFQTGNHILEYAKECAKIAVEEIIEVVQNVFEAYEERNYWNEVLKEIDLI